MDISAAARSRMLRPRSSATPHSVTTLSTVFFSVVTTVPGLKPETILDTEPSSVVERPSSAEL